MVATEHHKFNLNWTHQDWLKLWSKSDSEVKHVGVVDKRHKIFFSDAIASTLGLQHCLYQCPIRFKGRKFIVFIMLRGKPSALWATSIFFWRPESCMTVASPTVAQPFLLRNVSSTTCPDGCAVLYVRLSIIPQADIYFLSWSAGSYFDPQLSVLLIHPPSSMAWGAVFFPFFLAWMNTHKHIHTHIVDMLTRQQSCVHAAIGIAVAVSFFSISTSSKTIGRPRLLHSWTNAATTTHPPARNTF